MCFSAKVKTPKVETKAADPAPLTAEPTSVDFGGGEENDKATTGNDVVKGGRSSLKVDKTTSASTSIRNKFTGANYGTV